MQKVVYRKQRVTRIGSRAAVVAGDMMGVIRREQ